MFVNQSVLGGVLKLMLKDLLPLELQRGEKVHWFKWLTLPLSSSDAACVGSRSATAPLLTETFFSLEAKGSSPPINHFVISHLTREQTEAQVLHVLIFKYMLTSNIYTLNRSYGHLARSPALRGRPPDGESFQMKQEKKKKRKEKEAGRRSAAGFT